MKRIICCGNRNRGDDAAGLLVGERLREMGICAEVYEGDPLAMIERWDSADDVIIVDAVVTGAAAGTVQLWDAPMGASFGSASSSTHGLGVGEAIRLAEMLGRLPRRLRVYGVEGTQFKVGAGVSHKVQHAVQDVAERIASEVSSPQHVPSAKADS